MWKSIQAELNQARLYSPEQFNFELKVLVEEGARFFDLLNPIAGKRGQYEYQPSEKYEYSELFINGRIVET